MDILLVLVFIIILAALVYYLAKQVVVLIINGILGLAALFFMNFFHVMSWIGRPDFEYDLPTILICAVGGLPGVLVITILNIIGITV
jgi:inhibitor of the pro-sigma K processing machinery